MDETIKSVRHLKRLDISAEETNRFLGFNNGTLCKYCGAIQHYKLHWSDCALFKIRTSVLKEGIIERNKKLKKEANKQILFYNDKRYTTSKQRIRRKMSTRPRRKFTTLYPHEDV